MVKFDHVTLDALRLKGFGGPPRIFSNFMVSFLNLYQFPLLKRDRATPHPEPLMIAASLIWLITSSVAAASPQVTTFSGLCDASAGVALGDDLFMIASDEDNALRVYHRDGTTTPAQAFSMDAFLEVDPAHPEADIEAATTLNGRTYWITSHGRNKNGEERENRHRFWATDERVEGGQVRLETIGDPYKNLLRDLTQAATLRAYDLAAASRLAPEASGGLNIEGLAALADGSGLLIGFRNPVPRGRALLVPLLNPEQVSQGARAEFGAAQELDLGGLGIRTIQYSAARGEYLIVAGAYDSTPTFSLYAWSGASGAVPRLLSPLQNGDLKPEEIILWPGDSERVLLVSDDGDRQIGHKACKDLAIPEERLFRTWTLELSATSH